MAPRLWANRTIFEISKRVICEVDERLIRTHGENWIHINDVEALVEHDQADDLAPAIPPRSQEVIDATEVVGTLLASELIRDGDTLQIGIGDVTSALAMYLGEKRDLGIQTELIPGGIVDLVEQGVITGRHKQVAPGKVVGSAFAVLPPEEAQRVHMNPTYELWDFCNTDDLRTLVREENFVAINNALQVDLTGQVTAETLGGQVFSGPVGRPSSPSRLRTRRAAAPSSPCPPAPSWTACAIRASCRRSKRARWLRCRGPSSTTW
ncbi:MAG: acetyl-CoA hydrolase/transferase C-terminal domain-containing protein [Dehalococcoidia bacterium]|nr:acetyl-CoA hydrolase/transferase C-terminal domain-containing protein [Dehalococcoidia bacterium]